MGKSPSPPRSIVALVIALGPFIVISALVKRLQGMCQEVKVFGKQSVMFFLPQNCPDWLVDLLLSHTVVLRKESVKVTG